MPNKPKTFELFDPFPDWKGSHARNFKPPSYPDIKGGKLEGRITAQNFSGKPHKLRIPPLHKTKHYKSPSIGEMKHKPPHKRSKGLKRTKKQRKKK